jgi:hypothetical protein
MRSLNAIFWAALAAQAASSHALRSGETYSVHLYRAQPNAVEERVRLSCGGDELAAKTLHVGDNDWTLFLSVDRDCALTVSGGRSVKMEIVPYGRTTRVEREPNNDWARATPIPFGGLVMASGDDSAYLPPPSDKRGKPTAEYTSADEDWYRFEFPAGGAKLAHFQVELMERDNLPVDVSVFRVEGGKPVLFTEGEDPVSIPHEVQALPGNKFTTRVLRAPGTYYLRVLARHPEYRLRTRVYNAPPYADPHEAVQTAIDYLMGAGDSWHANTPRRGGVMTRVANVHQETSLCVACHVTHFTQRAQLYASRQGYAIEQRNSLQFLTERFYNNPRPLFGFEQEGAVWARVISAPANVLGRMSHLLDIYEREVTGERRESFHAGVKGYLDIYYQGRTKIPANETNGNQPLVSKYEVAWYAWENTKDPAVAALLEQDDIGDMIDLCYQTLALAAVDKQRHAAKIAANAERILSLQRESGQWPMKFDAKEKEAEFQTGHALWALAAAGVPRENPQVAKGLRYLLGRQQDFGGWLDPLQSFENFRTPLRETQMAVLALSAYYPAGKRKRGWGLTSASIAAAPEQALLDAQSVWDRPSEEAMAELRKMLASKDAFARQSAAEALGRLASPEDLPALLGLLGDTSKLVQRTVAWAVRQIYVRHPEVPLDGLERALASSQPRVQWGATRVFATHFARLAQEPKLAAALLGATRSANPATAIQAWKGLWQFWFWSPDAEVKSQIEDAFLAGLRRPQSDWVERNLAEGIYNIADENIRYLYNNWVPLLALESDQEKVIRGRLAIEARHAEKFARFLETADDSGRKRLLAALAMFDLRRADAYDVKADPRVPAPAVYSRIGNDIEQIVFFGEANTRIAQALLPLLESKDGELRRLAMQAGLMTRDARFAGVTKIAGQPSEIRGAFVVKEAPKPVAAASGVRAAHAKLERPDEAYFRGYVQPILEKRGKDGYACVQCHASHAIFTGSFASALNVVNLENAEESLILKKPTSSAESEGVVGAKATAHGGGVRFEKDSPEYNTILTWIRGAKP